jgi:hypothetical protein
MAPSVPTGNRQQDSDAFQKIVAEKKKYDRGFFPIYLSSFSFVFLVRSGLLMPRGATVGYCGELVAHPLFADAVLVCLSAVFRSCCLKILTRKEAYKDKEKLFNPELLKLPKCEAEIERLLVTVPKQTCMKSIDSIHSLLRFLFAKRFR